MTSYECRFAIYAKDSNSNNDIHYIKEIIHDDNGSRPNIRIVKNFKRDFYITKKGLRNHNSKKEWVSLNDVDKFTCTQTELTNSLAKALNYFGVVKGLRSLCLSPYVYGTDISSTSIIKQKYMDKYSKQTPYTNAVFDTETDVINGTEQIVMATISFKDKVFTCVQKTFVKGNVDVINEIKKKANYYIGDVLDKRKINLEIEIVDEEIDIIIRTMAKAHEWKPDFLSVWNLEFDMDKIIDACERAEVNIADILNDPIVPTNYRKFNFNRDASSRTTASGKLFVKNHVDRWNTVDSISSFQWVDAMSSYRKIRIAEACEQSYSLDSILTKHLNITKLKFDEAKDLSGLELHIFMQSKYPLEYIVYNIFDCISMEMLDECTKDITLSLPMFSGNSDLYWFKSQPKRAVDSLHFYCLSNNMVIGSTSSDMVEDIDDLVTNLSGWITMLPSHLITEQGLKCVKELPDIPTNIYTHVGDLDVSASYPNGIIVFNISKETTVKELISIEGIDEDTKRMATINLSGGCTNSVHICNTIFGLPTLDKWLDEYNI